MMPDASSDKLPVWDLSSLYPSMHDPEYKQDIELLGKNVEAFKASFAGKLKAMTGDALAEAVRQYEAIMDLSARITSFADLLFAENITDPARAKVYQDVSEKITAIHGEILFFTHEICDLPDGEMEEKLQSPSLSKFRPWLMNERAYRPYRLSQEIEKLLHEKSLTSRQAWIRLFDETLASLIFKIDGKNLSADQAFNLLTHADEKVRRQAAREIAKRLREREKIFALVTNTLIKDKQDDDTRRGFPRPQSSRNIANQVEDEVVDALISTVRKNYKNLSHRYYAWKAEVLGMKKLNYWDRNAPLQHTAESYIPWEEAKETVLNAFKDFSPVIADIAGEFFKNNWIDAKIRPGKASGAFSHPAAVSDHPYILVNYHGKIHDVMTLAHELGHGVHQMLAREQGALLADTPLTLAETASVFGEQLAFRAILEREKNEQVRRRIIAGKVEDMLNTVVRQIAFTEFEESLHTARRSGEITVEEIGGFWMKAQKASLGSAIKLNPDYACYWSHIPHFVHTPFYVYAYAFGDLLVNALYQTYVDGLPGFQDKYIELLKTGGAKRHKEMLAPFGLDASKPDFWQKGIKSIEGLIGQL